MPGTISRTFAGRHVFAAAKTISDSRNNCRVVRIDDGNGAGVSRTSEPAGIYPLNGSTGKVTSPDHEEPSKQESVTSLYGAFGDDLRLFLTGVLRDRELAAEALQSVFQKAIEKIAADLRNVRGWLFRVAYHEAMLIRRKQTRERKAFGQAALIMKSAKHSIQDAADTRSLREETVDRVRRSIQELPQNQQEVVRKRIYEEKTFAVIAEELGVPLGTVLTRMRLATERLQRALKDE